MMIVSVIKSSSSLISRLLGSAIPALLLATISVTAHAQKADPNDPKNVERGVELIKQVVHARGGERFLSYQTITSTGQFTPYDKGMSQIPIPFVDWIVYPDKERTEFGKGKKKNRRIQVNVGKTGWVYDGDAETLKDQTDKQIESHLEGIEFDIDRILRAATKGSGVEVRFAGREEIRPGERADVVEIQLKSGQNAYLWLDRQTHLPMSLIYERNEEGGLTKNEVRYFQYVDYDSVRFPNIVDFYRDGVQTGRINVQSVKLNAPVNDELFAKPANAKAIK
jgi:outer membrane lipoprotein-sorting protein